jgi:hypothetical protein
MKGKKNIRSTQNGNIPIASIESKQLYERIKMANDAKKKISTIVSFNK